METIFALATARGRAGVAVVRVSGPLAFSAAGSLAGSLPPPHRAGLRTLRDPSGAVLDEALVLCFPAGRSFTGEAVAELHLHGSLAVVQAVLGQLAATPGLRPAEAGEFTARAHANQRLSLPQVEALSDLIEAETEAQRRQAMRVFSGALGEAVEAWRSQLLQVSALLAASIDFADEEVPADVTAGVLAQIGAVAGDLRRHLLQARGGERLREGFEVAIVGRPNAGKSTLLNALAGRPAALTSSVAGTTRDVIEVRMDIQGLPVTLLDTAGLRETVDEVEAMGVALAQDRAARADLRIFLLEAGAMDPLPVKAQPEDITVYGKADLDHTYQPAISARTGAGVEELLADLAQKLSGRLSGEALLIRARHVRCGSRAVEALDRAAAELERDPESTDLAAEEVSAAIRALDSLIGRIDVEDVLGEIFSKFCIGK